MIYGAREDPRMSTPPPHPVPWLAISQNSTQQYYVVESQSWFDARAKAMVHFRCEPWEVELTRL